MSLHYRRKITNDWKSSKSTLTVFGYKKVLKVYVYNFFETTRPKKIESGVTWQVLKQLLPVTVKKSCSRNGKNTRKTFHRELLNEVTAKLCGVFPSCPLAFDSPFSTKKTNTAVIQSTRQTQSVTFTFYSIDYTKSFRKKRALFHWKRRKKMLFSLEESFS